MPPALLEDSAPCARQMAPRAQAAPTQPSAPPEPRASSSRPQQPASGRRGRSVCDHQADTQQGLRNAAFALFGGSANPSAAELRVAARQLVEGVQQMGFVDKAADTMALQKARPLVGLWAASLH